MAGRKDAFKFPPTHLISRLAMREAQKPIILAYEFDASRLDWSGWRGFAYSQRDHYFKRHDIGLVGIDEPAAGLNMPLLGSMTAPELWVLLPAHDAPIADFDAMMRQRAYQHCGSIDARPDTPIRRYAHGNRDCSPLTISASGDTDNLRYQFFAAELATDGASIIFVDGWQPKPGAALESLSISLQIIADDGAKLDQLERPLANPGHVRQHILDIPTVPPGKYRLMAVTYNFKAGERLAWREHDGEMLDLGEVVIPET